MRKSVSFVLAWAAMSLAVAACSDGTGDGGEPDARVEKTVLTGDVVGKPMFRPGSWRHSDRRRTSEELRTARLTHSAGCRVRSPSIYPRKAAGPVSLVATGTSASSGSRMLTGSCRVRRGPR